MCKPSPNTSVGSICTSKLQDPAMCIKILKYDAIQSILFQSAEICCNGLQQAVISDLDAAIFSVLQLFTVCCKPLEVLANCGMLSHFAKDCDRLQHRELDTCCTTLQHNVA